MQITWTKRDNENTWTALNEGRTGYISQYSEESSCAGRFNWQVRFKDECLSGVLDTLEEAITTADKLLTCSQDEILDAIASDLIGEIKTRIDTLQRLDRASGLQMYADGFKAGIVAGEAQIRDRINAAITKATGSQP